MTYILSMFSVLMLVGCGTSLSTSTTSTLKVRMFGTFAQPSGTTGTNDPVGSTYTFKDVVLTPATGATVSLNTAGDTDYKIIDRPQLIYLKEDMTDYEGLTFSAITVKFAPAITVKAKDGTDNNLTLTSGDLALAGAFTVSKAENRVLTIKIAWGKTVTYDDTSTPKVQGLSQPSFTLSFTE